MKRSVAQRILWRVVNLPCLLSCVLLLSALPSSLRADEPQGDEAVKPRARRMPAPKIDARAAGAEAIKLYDANKDGKLSGDELDKCPGLKAAIGQVDPDGTGEITADMITARIEAWQRTRLARMTVACTVSQDGKPLAGATVKFVPEKFLGKNLKAATGKTDAHGIAMMSIPTVGPRDPPGVAPGLYRVEITKEGENIPAKYNTATIFGQEVAIDAKGIRDMKGIKFNLKSEVPGG
jgi:hypothetical protein